jgi:small conductance mechanosensitive channel
VNWNSILQIVQEKAAGVGLQILGALLLYIIGRWLISLVVSAVQRILTRQKIEPTVLRFAGNTISVALNITLVVAILGYFGVQTTTFAALIAAMGLAIGTAWAGLLANFAAGAFLLVLRPFKVGDFITAGGVTGTVHEIGLFVTTFDTPDNIRTFIGNNKIFSDTIQNFTANPYRRVDLTAQIAGAADPHLAIARLKERVAAIPNVAKTPAPEVTILTFTAFGPVLAVRPYCHNDQYWQVYFDCNMVIREVLGDSAFPGPAYPVAMQSAQAAVAAG